MKKKYISIITVNYNGKKYLETFLASVKEINYPKDNFEIIVVDNASTDDSIAFVKKYYPQVKIIESDINLGFGGGNNLGIRESGGEFVLLVNNDTYLDKDILKNFTTCLKKDKGAKVAAYNAKLVLMDHYLPFRVENGEVTKYKITDKKVLGVNKAHYNLAVDSIKRIDYLCYIPVSHDYKGNIKIVLDILSTGKDNYKVFAGKELLIGGTYKEDQSRMLELEISANKLQKYRVNLIQNAGSIVFRNASGRDRGTIVSGHKQFYEQESQKYNKSITLDAFCGAGVFLKRSVLNRVGLFDEEYFMYYEDTDLSLRIIKAGYTIIYCPELLIRHVHSASSKEWSDFFVYHTERGRLLILLKHWPPLLTLKYIWKYLFRNTLSVFVYEILFNNYKKGITRMRLRLGVLGSIFVPFVKNIGNNRKLSREDIKKYK